MKNILYSTPQFRVYVRTDRELTNDEFETLDSILEDYGEAVKNGLTEKLQHELPELKPTVEFTF